MTAPYRRWAAASFGVAVGTAVLSAHVWGFPGPFVEHDGKQVRAVTAVSLEVPNTDGLARLFADLGYSLETVRGGAPVPRVLVASLPGDLRAVKSIKLRTRTFRKIILPMVLTTNEAIERDRKRMLSLLARKSRPGATLSASDNAWLDSLAREYRVKSGDYETLKRRVDVIPPSLALAQAIEESGWGTSNFARKGNALFGQETYLSSATGMPGKSGRRPFKIKVFPSLLEAVNAYARNLNTHPAYKDLRAVRAKARARGGMAPGHALAGTLLRYSERRGAYVRTIRKIIGQYELAKFDAATLAKGPQIHVHEAGGPKS